MKITDGFIAQFGYNLHAFERLTDGINHDISMILPKFKGNNINWIVGHLIESRNELLEVIGLPPIWTAIVRMKYQTGSKPVSDLANPGEGFERLLTDFRVTHDLLVEKINAMTEEELNLEIGDGEQKTNIAETINGYIWHETYHIGQLELLRQIVGKTEKVF